MRWGVRIRLARTPRLDLWWYLRRIFLASTPPASAPNSIRGGTYGIPQHKPSTSRGGLSERKISLTYLNQRGYISILAAKKQIGHSYIYFYASNHLLRTVEGAGRV